MSAKENKSVLLRAAEAFNNQADRSGWFDIHDPSVVAHGLGPEPLNLVGLKQFYSALWTGFPDLQITVDELVGDAEKVAWRLTARGTHDGTFRSIPATGTKVKFEAFYFFEFRNGKIVQRWTSLDRLGVLVQLGAIPSPV
jgi:steroid delta-isomerase-like uncharacterized protein